MQLKALILLAVLYATALPACQAEQQWQQPRRSFDGERRHLLTTYGRRNPPPSPSTIVSPPPPPSTISSPPPSTNTIISPPPPSPSQHVKFTPFSYVGGPADVFGVWESDRYIGILTNTAGFASTVFLPDGGFEQQLGKYTSWECTDVPGVYIATVLRGDTYSNGTRAFTEFCEVGQITPDFQKYFWNSSKVACPDPKTTDFTIPLYRVTSKAFPAPKSLYCDGTAGTGFNNGGKAGLTGKRPFGSVDGPPLPPPLLLLTNNNVTSFPPTFVNSGGGPGDVVGIWWSDERRTGELVDKDYFSSIALQPDGTFLEVLGEFYSYECINGGEPGSYKAALTFTLTQQDFTDSDGQGCTTGTVDLDKNTYVWSAADPVVCPGKGAPVYYMKRANTSEALPAPQNLTCK